MKLSEIDFPMARSKLLKKDLPSKDVLKTLPKTYSDSPSKLVTWMIAQKSFPQGRKQS